MVVCARSSGGSEGGKGEEEGLLLLLAGSLAGWLAVAVEWRNVII